MLSRLFIAALGSPAGKGLNCWLFFVIFNVFFVTFTCGILGHVWYLIVSFPDLYRLSYFQFSLKELFLAVILYSALYWFKTLAITKLSVCLHCKSIKYIRSQDGWLCGTNSNTYKNKFHH